MVHIVFKKTPVLILTLAMFIFAPLGLVAVTDSGSTIITADISASIGIVSYEDNLYLNVSPVSGGAQTSAVDEIAIYTNNVSGYTLTLANSDTNTSLVSGGNTITAHTGTQASPTILANNRWGYHVDGIGGFASDGAEESNVTSSGILYAGVPSSSSPVTIRSTSAPTNWDPFNVYYGARVDPSQPSGTYIDIVTYTATTNP